jgi:hypothetical protein
MGKYLKKILSYKPSEVSSNYICSKIYLSLADGTAKIVMLGLNEFKQTKQIKKLEKIRGTKYE